MPTYVGIRVDKLGDLYVARSSYEQKDIVKAAGFRWDGLNRRWWTRDVAIAAKLDPTLAAEVNRVRREQHAQAEASIAASHARDADFQPPAPAGLAYLPYQRAGIAYALAHRDCLIGDEMGLGKTIQAIGVINADPSINRVLVICKADLKLNWQRELRKWLVRPLDMCIVSGNAFPDIINPPAIVIINYEIVRRHRYAIDQIQWDCLIVDESHLLKNADAQRTHAVFGKKATVDKLGLDPIAARRRIFLTGTPILNRPRELWTLCHAIDRDGLGRSWVYFHQRYCAAHKARVPGRTQLVWDTTGASHLDELQTQLRSRFMVRRLKQDVLTELPPKRRQILMTPVNSKRASEAVKAEKAVVEAADAEIAVIRAEVERLSEDRASDLYKAAVRRLRQAEAVKFNEMARVRHETALAKVPDVVEHVLACLDEHQQKVVVFGHHRDVIDSVIGGLVAGGVPADAIVRAHGDDSVKQRDAREQAFQTDDKVRVIVAGIYAFGAGHNLWASSHVVFAELDWVPGNMCQAEDRLHRIGQRDAVLVQHVVLQDSLDAHMANMLVEKQAVIESALNNGNGGGLKPPELMREPSAEEISEFMASVVAAPAKQGNNGAIPKKPPASSLPALTERQIGAIHVALKTLAGRCDGAYERDDQGFSRFDAQFGHDLAGKDRLSVNQALAGRRLAIKYKRQLPAELLAAIEGKDA